MSHIVVKFDRWIIDIVLSVGKFDMDGVISCLYEMSAPFYTMYKARLFMNEHPAQSSFVYLNQRSKRALVLLDGDVVSEKFLHKLSRSISGIISFSVDTEEVMQKQETLEGVLKRLLFQR